MLFQGGESAGVRLVQPLTPQRRFPPVAKFSNRRRAMTSLAIGFVLFPNLTQLDFTGPLQVLHRLPDSKTHIVAKTRDPVPRDCGLSLVTTTTFAECGQLY